MQLGAAEMASEGARGITFPGCPAWWARSPAEYPGRSYGAGGRTVASIAGDARWWLEHGSLGRADALPGRLDDCVRRLVGEEARRLHHRQRAQKAKEWRDRKLAQAGRR